jgi:hypothetical protein
MTGYLLHSRLSIPVKVGNFFLCHHVWTHCAANFLSFQRVKLPDLDAYRLPPSAAEVWNS